MSSSSAVTSKVSKAGRQRGKKVLVGIVIEVRGHGSGPLRLQVPAGRVQFIAAGVDQGDHGSGAIVHTDGYQAYNLLAAHGYDHRRRPK